MAKLNLVASPTFVAKVPVMPAGDDSQAIMIPMTFKHRTRAQLSEWLNSRAGKTDVESFMDMVTAWEIEDVPFTAENIEALFENYGGTPRSALNVYVDQLYKGKSGN